MFVTDNDLMLYQIVSNIEKRNYTYEFINSEYHYFYEITCLFKILDSKKYKLEKNLKVVRIKKIKKSLKC